MKHSKDASPSGFSEYIAACPVESRDLLNVMWQTIGKLLPNAEERISYGIPTFKYNGKNLVHFAGYKNHIGFYPGAAAIEAFALKLSLYQVSKGTVQFPIDKKLPVALIREIVRYCINRADSKSKSKIVASKEKPADFLSVISAPARRALEAKGIRTLKKLSGFSETDLLALHGVGPSAVPKLKQALKTSGLSFKK